MASASHYPGLLALLLLVVLVTHQLYLRLWGWTYLQPEFRNVLFWPLICERALSARPTVWLTEEGVRWVARQRSYDLVIAFAMGISAVAHLALN